MKSDECYVTSALYLALMFNAVGFLRLIKGPILPLGMSREHKGSHVNHYLSIDS